MSPKCVLAASALMLLSLCSSAVVHSVEPVATMFDVVGVVSRDVNDAAATGASKVPPVNVNPAGQASSMTSISTASQGSDQTTSTVMGTDNFCGVANKDSLDACLDQLNWHCTDRACSCELERSRVKCFEFCPQDGRHAVQLKHMQQVCTGPIATLSMKEIHPVSTSYPSRTIGIEEVRDVHTSLKNGKVRWGRVTESWNQPVHETNLIFVGGIETQTVWTGSRGYVHTPVVKVDEHGGFHTFNTRRAAHATGVGPTTRSHGKPSAYPKDRHHRNSGSINMPGLAAMSVGALGALAVAL